MPTDTPRPERREPPLWFLHTGSGEESAMMRWQGPPGHGGMYVREEDYDALARETEELRERITAITANTLEESSKVPESLRGDRDLWQQNATYWNGRCVEAWAERDRLQALVRGYQEAEVMLREEAARRERETERAEAKLQRIKRLIPEDWCKATNEGTITMGTLHTALSDPSEDPDG